MELFYYPLSRYSQKVLIALYEKQINFYPRIIDLHDPIARRKIGQLSDSSNLPVLKSQQDEFIPESSIIIEYLDQLSEQGSRLLPQDKELRLQVRLYDRLIDNKLNNVLYQIEQMTQNSINKNTINQLELKQHQNKCMSFLQQLDKRLACHFWICGDSFTLADCALIPCLAYARQALELFELDNLNRYWQQAELRGSWMLVKEEIEIIDNQASSGLRNIP